MGAAGIRFVEQESDARLGGAVLDILQRARRRYCSAATQPGASPLF
jgi:hypothetical protein